MQHPAPHATETTPFPLSARGEAFRARHFPNASAADWGEWRWQLQHRLRSPEDFRRFFQLSPAEAEALERPGRDFPVSLTPYYASLLEAGNPLDPLRRTMLPVPDEFVVSPSEYRDPLAEDAHTPVPGVVHRYPDRALFLMGEQCPVYCRYCTRSRLVGGPAEVPANRSRWQRGLDYIARTPAIRDVLVSGGDPLIYPDAKLDWLLAALHAIPHVEMIRLGTKIPMVLPQRITPALCAVLGRYPPLYLSVHATHPRELTLEVAEACRRLACAGVVMRSQTVLLKGINDDAETIRELMHGLLKVRISPYYLLQGDPIQGSAHFRTPVQAGIDIIRALRGHTSGYAVPHFIVDTPNGGGKISLDPDYVQARDGDDLLITNYEGKGGFRYPDPLS